MTSPDRPIRRDLSHMPFLDAVGPPDKILQALTAHSHAIGIGRVDKRLSTLTSASRRNALTFGNHMPTSRAKEIDDLLDTRLILAQRKGGLLLSEQSITTSYTHSYDHKDATYGGFFFQVLDTLDIERNKGMPEKTMRDYLVAGILDCVALLSPPFNFNDGIAVAAQVMPLTGFKPATLGFAVAQVIKDTEEPFFPLSDIEGAKRLHDAYLQSAGQNELNHYMTAYSAITNL